MRQQPDWNLLPIFVTVADAGSISVAARLLGLPKSSISRGIAALEGALGVQLFHRTTRKLAVTTAGQRFYDRVRPLVLSLKDLAGSLPEQGDDPSGELRISAPIDMALTWLVDAIAEFAALHPAIRLDVRPTNRYVDVVAEGFDVSLRVGRKLADSSLIARRLSDLAMAIYASPSYIAQRGEPRTVDQLASHEWVNALRVNVISPELTLPREPRLATDDLMFACRAIECGMGIGLLPTFLGQREVAVGRLVRVLPRWSSDSQFGLFYVYPAGQHVPRKVTAFRDFLVQHLASHPLAPPR